MLPLVGTTLQLAGLSSTVHAPPWSAVPQPLLTVRLKLSEATTPSAYAGTNDPNPMTAKLAAIASPASTDTTPEGRRMDTEVDIKTCADLGTDRDPRRNQPRFDPKGITTLGTRYRCQPRTLKARASR